MFLLVYNVSVTPEHGHQTFKLKHLSPGQEYKVWIRAVTAAGPGANVTMMFKTNHPDNSGMPSYSYCVVHVVRYLHFWWNM